MSFPTSTFTTKPPADDFRMQVDEPTPPKFFISETTRRRLCRVMELNIQPTTDDDYILGILSTIWFVVSRALSEDKSLHKRLVDEDRFRKNVYKMGVGSFINLLRDMARRRSWEELLENEVFLKQPGPEWSLSLASKNAAVGAWRTTFKGEAANVLIKTIANYLDERRDAYVMQTCIVNSSGTGKSRIVHEAARKIITVPMCLRAWGTRGFPPPDTIIRDWFEKQTRADPNEQTEVTMMLHDFIYSLLTVLLDHLKDIELKEHFEEAKLGKSSIPRIPSSYDPENCLSLEDVVKKRQEVLASKFCDLMTRNMTFECHDDYRVHFYNDVIFKTEQRTRVSQYIFQVRRMIKNAAENLCRFIDPHRVLDSDSHEGSRWPLVILAFDESHILNEFPRRCSWTVFSALRDTLQAIVSKPIFSLFLSTAGSLLQFSPEIESSPSGQVVNHSHRTLDPITEISFDDIAYPAKEYTVLLSEVVTIKWISHLGRPLFGVYYDQLGDEDDNANELVQFAKQKLLCGKPRLEKGDSPGSLACLSVRFALEFNAGTKFREVACKQIERHMRLCLAATTGCETLITFSGSEPLLAEAASQLMHESMANPAQHLANHSDLHCVDRGRRGELVAALILMKARDEATQMSMHRARWVSISSFMQALLPEQNYMALQGSRPTSWRTGEDKPFSETFQDYAVWFNHVIRIQDDTLINAGHLWSFITRGAMIICDRNQAGVDIIIPLCLKTERLSRKTVSAILIQVKNSSKYGNKVNTKLFENLCPFQVGLFDEGSTPRPVIRMIFALASQESEVHFLKASESCNEFTGFDIWFSGLSCFGSVHKDDLVSYQVLLDRSLRPHDAFDLGELVRDEYLDDETRQVRGLRRRRIAALTMDDEEHRWLHR